MDRVLATVEGAAIEPRATAEVAVAAPRVSEVADTRVRLAVADTPPVAVVDIPAVEAAIRPAAEVAIHPVDITNATEVGECLLERADVNEVKTEARKGVLNGTPFLLRTRAPTFIEKAVLPEMSGFFRPMAGRMPDCRDQDGRSRGRICFCERR